jgi:hypothetical protein
MKLGRLIKMSLNETCCKTQTGKHLSDSFPIQKNLKQDDALSPMLSDFSGEKGITKVQQNKEGMKLHGTYQLLAYAEDCYLLGEHTRTIRKNPCQWSP